MTADAEPVIRQHAVSRRWAILEDDGLSAWLYITEPEVMAPMYHCWIYNRILAPLPSEIPQYRDGPPPACEGYITSEALYTVTPDTKLDILWSEDGQSVAALVNEVVFGFISLPANRSCSRNLSKAGPWGEPWDEAAFEAAFAAR